MDMWKDWVNVGTKCACGCRNCVYINKLIHHNTSKPTSYWHHLFLTHLLLSFFFTHSLSFSLTTPWMKFRGFSWGRQLLSCWASVTHFVQPQPASVDTGRSFKGAEVQWRHSKSLAYNTTLKIIIYFTDSAGIVGCTVADSEKYAVSEEKKIGPEQLNLLVWLVHYLPKMFACYK